eukprot:gene3158-3461_t
MLSLRPSLKLAISQSRFFSSGAARKTGVVRSFDRMKGYGFINTSEPGDIFVHWKQIQSDGFSSLVAGETVEFTSAFDSKNRTVANEVTAPGGGKLTAERLPRNAQKKPFVAGTTVTHRGGDKQQVINIQIVIPHSGAAKRNVRRNVTVSDGEAAAPSSVNN